MNANHIQSKSPLHNPQISEYELADLFRPEGTIVYGPTPIQIESRTLKKSCEELTEIAYHLNTTTNFKAVEDYFTVLTVNLCILQNTNLNTDSKITTILSQIRLRDITRTLICEFLIETLLPALNDRILELDNLKK